MTFNEIKQMYKQTEDSEDTDGSKGPMNLSENVIFGYDESDHVLDIQETLEITEGLVGNVGDTNDTT